MGGDFGPRVIVPALVASLRKHSGVSALLFGDQQKLAAEISHCKDSSVLARIHVRHCEAVVSGDDKPSTVLRHKRDSTMGLAVKAVAEGDAKACISAGNTGALMALGLVFLKTLPGISRPAICTTFPTSQGRSYMLDLGANLECSPQQLHQFALLGSLTAQALDGIVEPTIRLVNVGEEAGKGGQSMAETAALLSGDPLLNYQGYVEGDAKACISAGNTGALMALGLVFLKTLPGISRPAICTTFPTSQGRSYMLDLGANLECSPQQLHQFALLGSLTAQALDGIVEPTIRLVNVGEEAGKGGQSMAETAALLSGDPLLNYQGYVEGDGIFEGTTDVVVCDGFTGNVALKTSEGLATMINGMFKARLKGSWTARIGAIFMRSLLLGLKSRLDPALYNGAYLLGLNGVVVKSHGGASEKAFGHALDVAIEAAKHNLPEVLSPILQGKIDNGIK